MRPLRSPNRAPSDTGVLLCLAAIKLLLHLLSNGHYGFFRDELYYIACGEHLDWGYVDQPPLIAVIARASRLLLGHSLSALRFLPAVAGAGMVFLSGAIARELGGKRFAQALAALAVMVAPFYLAVDTFLSMNAFEPIFWMLAAYLVVRIVNTGEQRWWLLFGAVSGIGLLNKHSMLFFGLGVFLGVVLTPDRRVLRGTWIWLAAAIALLIFSPNLIWEGRHGWPQLEVLRNARQYKNYAPSTAEFLLDQVLLLHPLTFPIWAAGLYFYFVSAKGKPYRVLGWTFAVMLVLFIGLKGKVYYLAPAYPMLLAAGAVVIEDTIERRRWRWLKPAVAGVLIAGGMITAPYGLPLLPVDTFIRYDAFLRLGSKVKGEREEMGKLPQLYADMFGWEELAATVADVYHRLPPEERRRCAVLADDYGEAGAIDLFGGAHGLPKAISGHNSYYLWGPGDYSGEVVVTVGYSADLLKPLFGEVLPAATIVNRYAMPEESHLPVYICRRPTMPLRQAWPRFKDYR